MSDGIDWDRRLSDALQALADNPRDRMAELQRIQATLGKGKFAMARAMAMTYLRAVPDDPRAWDMLGAAHLYRGENEAAAAASAKAVEHDPDYHVARYNLACALVRLGRLDEAVAELSLCFRHAPETREHAADDEDMRPLAGDPRFVALLEA
jgi:predicted Zn-dependent protease